MLANALKSLVKNPVKESFYGKRKKTINVLTIFFFIFHKSDVNVFTLPNLLYHVIKQLSSFDLVKYGLWKLLVKLKKSK